MRCSLGARRGKRNAGEGICHGSGDAGAWGRFFGHDGPEGDGFPADTMGRRGDGLSCGIPCAGSMGNGACVFGRFPSVMRKGEPVRRALFLRVARGRGGAVRSRQERRRFFGLMETDALTGAFFLGVTREGESVRRAASARRAALPLRAARGLPSGYVGRWSRQR